MSPEYDVIVIGSGFGGSVTALRLSEKGYRVGVLEQGARWRPEDYPPDSLPMRKTLWQPYFGLTGPLRMTILKNVAFQSAVGVGGGSLIYGNVLYEPREQFYNDPQWSSIADWKAELAPCYDQAKRMLGVATNPRLTPADEVFKSIADDLGVADTFHPTQVGAFFGEPGKTVPDPYFGGIGPDRAGCVFTSSIHPDANTHIEAFRVGKGSNRAFLLTTTLVDGDRHRLAKWVLTNLRHPTAFARSFNARRASERSISLLVMQDLNNSLTTYLKRGLFGAMTTSRQGVGAPNPNWNPVGNDVARRAAEKIGGDPRGWYFDIVNRPSTAHFIGGCPLGDSPATGVVDAYQRLYGYPGLHIIDGSTITANLGVNPVLTITALSERAVALWPNKGEPDPRPPLESTYQRISPVRPHNPIVPDSAPAALRLTAI
jgi:choline dehydrogenase-like flavoprotein